MLPVSLHAVGQQAGEPKAVFVFCEDGSGVDAYPSLRAVRGDIEAIDVRNGEYALFGDDGRVIEATTGGRLNEDVLLRVTDNRESEALRERLSTALPRVGIDPTLASSPLLAAQALIDAQWSVRWPRWPAWLDRRLHGSKPVVIKR